MFITKRSANLGPIFGNVRTISVTAMMIIYFAFLLQVLLKIFSYLSHKQILKFAVVSKKWHMISQDSRLWGFVSLRPEISGLHVQGESHMVQQLIPTKFRENLRYLETNADLVTPTVLQDLAKKCPNLTHLLLDFAQASQLHDFTDLSAFPTKLKFLALYLSDTIFLDNFMKRIYRYVGIKKIGKLVKILLALNQFFLA